MGSNTSKLLEDAKQRGTNTLNLSNNRLSSLSPEIEQLKETLLRLSLSSNALTYLPYEASKLTRLAYVNLSDNKFKMFPTVLCELPSLEVIDLSNNRIKRFPSQLGVSLKILSLANNRVTVLSSCILESNLKILDVEGNPIVFPPKSILKKKKGGSEEEWLEELKDWLRENDSSLTIQRRKLVKAKEPHTPLDESSLGDEEKKSLALQKVMSEQEQLKMLLKQKKEEEIKLTASFQVRRHTSQNSTGQVPALGMLKILGQRNPRDSAASDQSSSNPLSDDCEEMCNRYFRISDLEKLAGREKNFLQACKSLLLADLQIWKAVKQGLQSSSNRNLTKILWRVQIENSDKLTDFVVKLEDCEIKRKASPSSLKDLGVSGLQLTQSLRRLIKSFLPLLPTLSKTTDIRIIKNILLSWTTSVADVYEAIELLTNRFPDLEDGPSVGVRPRSGSNEFLIRGASAAHNTASNLLGLLQEANKIARVQGELKDDEKFLNVLSGLEKTIPTALEATGQLGHCLRGWDEGTSNIPTLVTASKSFVHAVSKVLVVARIVDSSYAYNDVIIELLNEASNSSRFLAACLTPADERESLSTNSRLLKISAHQKSVSHGLIH